MIDASGAGSSGGGHGAVLPHGHRVPMLLGGEAAQVFADAMTPFGMRLGCSPPAGIGSAAAVMCRSIVVKGLEALMVSACSPPPSSMPTISSSPRSTKASEVDWKSSRDYMTGRVVMRRAARAEMDEVSETLRAIGIVRSWRNGASAGLGGQTESALTLRSRRPHDVPGDAEGVV